MNDKWVYGFHSVEQQLLKRAVGKLYVREGRGGKRTDSLRQLAESISVEYVDPPQFDVPEGYVARDDTDVPENRKAPNFTFYCKTDEEKKDAEDMFYGGDVYCTYWFTNCLYTQLTLANEKII